MIPELVFNNNMEKLNKEDAEAIKHLREELKNYNMIDFLLQISGLILIPENQSKSVIFQAIISTALSLKHDDFKSENIMSRNKLEYFIKEFSNLNRKYMIDPPEFPFALPAIYYGNYHLFMGASTLAPHYLDHMLKILGVHKDDFPYEDYRKFNTVVKGLLNVSEFVYNSLNIKLNDLKSFNKDIDIKIPSASVLKSSKETVTFSKEDMVELFGEQYEQLVIEFGEISIDEIDDFDNQKFYRKPFVRYGEKFVLVDCTVIIMLLMDMIIKFFMSYKIDVLKDYNLLLLQDLHRDFTRMGFQLLDSKQFELELESNNIVDESIYLCGNDIVFYNIVLFDDGKDYETNKEYKYSINNNYISNRIKKVKKQLLKHGFKEDKIVVIITPTTIGRNTICAVYLNSNKNLLMLSPYELTSICINESEENMFLYKYIVARNRLKHYKKNLFTELNFVALFSERDKSFYLGDECDSKEASLFFIGEYSSDYILKSYIKNGYHLALFSRTSLLEVMKKEDGVCFAPGLFYKRQLNNLLEFNKFNIWVLSEENIDNNSYHITNLIIDMISYWLNQFSTLFKDLNGVFKINIHCDPSIYITHYDKDSKVGKILFNINSRQLDITFEKNSLRYFESTDNDKEKDFISNIVKKICEIYQIEYPSELINQIFSNKYKKKLIIMNSNDDGYMLPFEDECVLCVSNVISNLIIDDVGLYLKDDKKIPYGKIEDYKILNDVVGHLYNNILKNIKKYNKRQLIDFLYLEFEKNLSSLLIRQANYASNLVCYPDRKKEIDEKINDLNRTSVALKFIIELVSSIKIDGTDDISLYEIEYILTEASKIIDYAYTCDIYNYKMADNTLTLLNSNRLGYNKDFLIRANHFLKNAKMGRMGSRAKDKQKMISQYETEKKDIPGFEEAFEDEFGFAFKDFTEVTVSLLEIAEDKNGDFNTLYSTTIKELKDHIKNKVSDDTLNKIILYLSQVEREDYLNPPTPYRNVDVFPWRNNRELSLNRKPLIIYKDEIIYGYRSLLNAIYFLFEIINNATFKARSKKMKTYLGIINKQSGEDFNEKVYNYLCTFPNSIVDKKVSKINGIKINDSDKNTLGDIDVLFISKKFKRIIVCEVKNFELSRNMYEMYNEYHDLFDPDNEKSFYNKHMKRVEWCKDHIMDIIQHYGLEKKKWRIDYCFIVNEPLISDKAMKVNINAYVLENIDKFIK